MGSGKIGWDAIQSPKELEDKEGKYKGGAGQSTPKTSKPKVD